MSPLCAICPYLLIGAGIIFLLKCAVIVRHNTVVIVERFGQYSRSLHPGVHVLHPFVETPATVMVTEYNEQTKKSNPRKQHIIPTNETPFELCPLNIWSKESVKSTLNVALRFIIVDPKKFVYAVPDPGVFINTTAQDLFARAMMSKTTDEILASSSTLCNEIKERMKEPLGAVGISLSAVLFQDLRVPDEIRKAIEHKVFEQNKHVSAMYQAKAQMELEQEKKRMNQQLEMEQAKHETKMLQEKSIAEAETALKQADTECETILRRARAQAAATRERTAARVEIFDSTSLTDAERAAYLLALEKCDAQREMMSHASGAGSRIYMPYDDKVIGTSLLDLVTSAFGTGNTAASTPIPPRASASRIDTDYVRA